MVFHGPHPDIAIPEMSLHAFVLQGAERLGQKPALIDGPTGRAISYGELAAGVRRAAASLGRRGFRKGDVLALYAPNLPEYPLALYAATLAGGTVTTVNALYTVAELVSQLRDAGASLLVTAPPLAERALAAAAEADVREVFCLGDAPGATPFASLLEGGDEPPAIPIDPRRDLAIILYSSGTSGLPKGVMRTHYGSVAATALLAVDGCGEEDTLAGVAPFSHVMGLHVIMNAGLAAGATIVTMPRFDLEQFLQLVERYRITRANLAPPVVLMLAKHPLVDRYDLSSLELILSGGAPLGAELARACAERIGCVVRQGYGLTEAAPIAHQTPGFEPPGSVGPCLPNTECRVVDPATGRDLEAGQPGELWFRGPQVMTGYLNQPAATAAAIEPDPSAGSGQAGWLRTGDVGFVDAAGCIHIVDRLKEMIKYKGYQVAPAELEAVLVAHPAISDAAVIPSPDEEAGEVPKAFVVLKGGATPDELMAWVAERVAPYKRVRRVEQVDRIPRSPSGKILRRVLVERERAARSP